MKRFQFLLTILYPFCVSTRHDDYRLFVEEGKLWYTRGNMRQLKLFQTIFIILLFPVQLLVAQESNSFTIHVENVETGEALPFAQVYRGGKNLTMTNFDGDFSIKGSPTDSICITCFGYKPINKAIKDLGLVVQMEMLTKMMHEVTIRPIEYWLIKASKKLRREYRRHQFKKARYFYRERMKHDSISSLIEAFVDANSAVNLRHLYMRTGRQMGAKWKTSELWLNSQVGVMTKGVKYWKEHGPLISPLSSDASEEFYKKYYNITYKILDDSRGGRIYQIHFQKKKDNTRQSIITGFLFLDAETLSPLVMHGHIENVEVWTGGNRHFLIQNCKVSLHLEYTHVNGFSEVSNITTFCVVAKGLTNRTTLFRLEKEISRNEINFRGSELGPKETIVKHVNSVGYDSAFWASHQIIKQTAEERFIATSGMK